MRAWYRACRLLCRLVFSTIWRTRVIGIEQVPRDGGVLLIANHQSFLDPVIATQALPRECHYMARDSLFRNRLFRGLIQSLNAFPVKRGSADLTAIKETLKRLRGGALITLFPEATRTEDGSVRPMQAGAVLVARKAGVPIIPTLILGAFEVWPRKARFPRPGRILVAYGAPISPAEMESMKDEVCVETVRQRILGLMARHRSHPHIASRLLPLPESAEAEMKQIFDAPAAPSPLPAR